MKPKFLLTILALNTLFLAASSAPASSIEPKHNIAKLSHSISNLIGLDPDFYPVVAVAIDRAMTSKKIAASEDKKKGINMPHPKVNIRGRIAVPKPSQKPAKAPEKQSNKDIDR